MKGALLADLKLGEGAIYHPGGMDYDGRDIWVPVSEYRPNSRAIIYRIDPETMKATAVFRFGDHIGAIVHDIDGQSLYGASWGSRRFYRWSLDARRGRDQRRRDARQAGPCEFVTLHRLPGLQVRGKQRMVCTGLSELRQRPDAPAFRLGGLELLDLS